MSFKIKIKTKRHIHVGSALIAQPFWADEMYKRAVILITDHDANGSRGIIVNKASAVHINEALPDIDSTEPMYFGGPIASRMVSYVHAIPSISEAERLGEGLYIGGNQAELDDMIQHHKIDFGMIKFCAGAVEWNPGQLQSEVDDNKWSVVDMTMDELFYSPPEMLWAYKLLKDGNMYGLFAHIQDPSIN